VRRGWPFLLALILWLGGAARDMGEAWIEATVLPPALPATSVEVRDRAGALLRAYTVADGRWRLAVRPDQVDPGFVAMLLAYEDKRFFRHAGVDPLALLRAAAQAAWHGRIVAGGSTLTMQVARLLEETGTGAWPGKLRQMRVALALERRLGKEEILGLYLTLAPYGGNIEGLRAATLAWFGKEPARLTPAQAALLVALPQSPVARRPDRAPDAARAARDRVLARLVRQGSLSAEAAQAATSEPVPAARIPFAMRAPHLADRVLAAAPGQLRHDLTLDAGVQAKLEGLAAAALRGLGERLSIAILVADHRTGAVLASVGSAGLTQEARQGFVDMTTAPRSPGSTLKPLVYALAFDRGLAHPETLIDDRPVAFGRYAPQNFDGLFRGDIRVAEALRLSLNIPVVRLTEAMGPANLMAALRRAGTEAVLPGGQAGLAVALGGVGVSLEGLVQLYAGLAQGGQAVPLYWTAPAEGARERIVSPAAAWQVAHIMAGMPPPPGAAQMRLAYKTGTSYGHRDAWAIGFDGAHVVGVWIGRPDGTPVPGAFGGDLAAPVLFHAFQRLKPQAAPLPPPPPETLIAPNASLPLPLQRFGGGGGAVPVDAPRLAFPPDGARLPLAGQALTVKLRDGVPPFTWLADGAPMVVGTHRREAALEGLGKGHVTLSVIDAAGRADRVQVVLE
jgi:penicillin-binding protein 1C